MGQSVGCTILGLGPVAPNGPEGLGLPGSPRGACSGPEDGTLWHLLCTGAGLISFSFNYSFFLNFCFGFVKTGPKFGNITNIVKSIKLC